MREFEQELACEQRADLLAEANQALLSKVDWVVNWYRRDTRHSLVSRWQLGEQIAEVMDDQSNNGCRLYGAKAFQTIAAFSGEAEGSLRMCARLAEAYTLRDIERIADMTMADGVTPLSFSHVRVVLSIEDRKERDKALARACENCWTSDDLARHVRGQSDERKASDGRGRPIAVPKTVGAVIAQQLSFAEDFEKRNVRVWRDRAHSVTGQLANLPEDMYTEELANNLARLAHSMRQVVKEAEERAEEAEANFAKVRRILENKISAGVKFVAEAELDTGSRREGPLAGLRPATASPA